MPCVVAAWLAIVKRREWRSLWAPLLSPLGVAGFFAYLWAHTGTPFAWFIAQRRGWQPGALGSGIWNGLLVIRGDHLSVPPYTVKAAGFVVAMALLAIFLASRRPGPWTGYVVAVLALAFLSPIVGFTPRVLLRGFPLLGVVAARLRPGWFEALLVIFALSDGRGSCVVIGEPRSRPEARVSAQLRWSATSAEPSARIARLALSRLKARVRSRPARTNA